jgi:hypothetical protein
VVTGQLQQILTGGGQHDKEKMTMKNDGARYIRMHDNDNVAIVVNDGGLAAGTVFADGLVLLEAVPQAAPVT